jgi:hypothetical protein
MTDFDPDSASSQLRVIRSLMERATIYRSLSAPTAFAGGLLSFGGLGIAYATERARNQPLSESEFLAIWLAILVLTGLINGFVLWREAQRRGQPFFSAGMKCAMASVLPPFLCAGFFTCFFTLWIPVPPVQAAGWITFYGLGLLAMQHFAPRSLVVLGWAFLLSLLAGWLINPHIPLEWRVEGDDALLASWMMALTFGLFHIVYAVAVWTLGGERTEVPAPTPTESGNV